MFHVAVILATSLTSPTACCTGKICPEAEPLLLAVTACMIREKAPGPEHPDVA